MTSTTISESGAHAAAAATDRIPALKSPFDATGKGYTTPLQILGGLAYVDVASATTTDIGAVASDKVRITGTTTITGLGTVASGTRRSVRFAAALTLTHNATSLILPGAVNITTAAGDTCEAVSEGSGNWRVINYAPASGFPVNKAILKIVATYAELTALTAATGLADNGVYITYGRTAEEDGGFGFWRWDAGSSATADSGTVLAHDTISPGRFLREYEGNTVRAKWFGVKSDGTTQDHAALQLATNTGKIVELDDGTTTLIGSGIAHVTGSGLVARGRAILKAKTGTGAFNIKTTTVPRTGVDRNMYQANQTDDLTIRNIHFTTDAATEVYLNGIRMLGGMATEGYHISGVSFDNFAASQLVAVGSLGAGRRRFIHITSARNCSVTQGSSYWTGGCQTTVFEIDNDLISSTPSSPGVVRIDLIKSILFSSTALTDFAQQTDGVNIIGQGANSTSGWDIEIGTCDGIGEAIDVQGFGNTVRAGYIKNAYNDAVKLIHGASHNTIEVGVIEACGRSAVGIFGSNTSPVANNTTGNTVRIGTVKTPGTYGLGTSGSTSVVLFGNANLTYKPTRNKVFIDNFIGDGVNLDYGVSDGSTDANTGNEVTIGRGNGWAIASCLAPPGNEHVRCLQRSYTEMTMSGAQTIATGTNTAVALNTAGVDVEAIADTANNKVRVVWPGLYQVTAAGRWNGASNLTDGNEAIVRALVASATVATATVAASAAAQAPVAIANVTVYIDENDMAGVNADISMQVRQDSGADRTLSHSITKLTVARVG